MNGAEPEGAEKSSRRQVLVAIPAGAAGSILSWLLTTLFSRAPAVPAPPLQPIPPCDPTPALEARLKTLEDDVRALRAVVDEMRVAERDRANLEKLRAELDARLRSSPPRK